MKSFSVFRLTHSVAVFALSLSFVTIAVAPLSLAGVEKAGEYANTAIDRLDSLLDHTQIGRIKGEVKDRFGVTLVPYLKTKMNYTDNVFTQPDTDRDDVVWTIRPGMSATYVNPKIGVIGVSYEAALSYFTKHGKQNEQDQFIHTYGEFHPMENLTLDFSENFSQQGGVAARDGLKPINYRDNTATVGAEYDWRKWTPRVGYENFQREYAGDVHNRIDYSEDKWLFRLSRDVTEEIAPEYKKRAFVGYDLGLLNYEHTANRASHWWEIYTGVNTELPWSSELTAQVGVHRRHPNVEFRNGFTALVTDISASKDFANSLKLTAGFRRDPQESTFDDQLFSDDKLWYYKALYKFTPKLRGRAGLRFGNSDWEGAAGVGAEFAKRTDWHVGTSLGFDYAAREWLIFHIDYDWNRRDSSFSDFDYGRNDFSVGMTMPL